MVLLSLVITLMLIFGSTPALADESSGMRIVVNGDVLKLDTYPLIENSRTLVPFRAILEALGADVTWDGETKSITASNEDTGIVLVLDNTTAQVNGVEVQLDVTAKAVNSRTFVPLRFVGEALGADVFYEAKTKTIYISKGFYGNTPSNLKNGGVVLATGDSYYIGQSSGLMKYDNETDEKTTLLSAYAEGLNKVGDYLYFVSDGFVKRLNLLNQQLETIQSDQESFSAYECMTIYENWIYYIGSGDAICRMRLDGSGYAVLNSSGANEFFIYDGSIYFGNGSDDCKVYSMDLKGKNVKKVCDIKGSYSLSGVIYDGWIYFTAEPQYVTNLYRMRPDGSELEMIRENILYLSLLQNKLIFTQQNYEFTDDNTYTNYILYETDLSQDKTEKLYEGNGFVYGICFKDEYGFYFGLLDDNEADALDSSGLYYYSFEKDDIELIDERAE